MSFILDALKKSESERQARHGPDLAYAPGGRSKGRVPRWVIALGVLLLVNLAVLLSLALRDTPAGPGTATEPVAAQAVTAREPAPQRSTPPATRPAPSIATTRQSSTDTASTAVRSLADEAGNTAAEPVAFGQANPAAREPAGLPASPVPAPAGTGTAAESTLAGTPPASSPPTDFVPTLNELQGQGRMMQLQGLSLDLHVYAAQSSERFVFFNLTKYQEGQRLKEGPLVEQITNTGVILQYQGERFLIPRS